MNNNSYHKKIWEEALSRARQKYDVRADTMKTLFGILLTFLIVIVIVGFGMWNKNDSIPAFMWGLFSADILVIISTILVVPIMAYFDRWNIAAELDAKKEQEIANFEHLLDVGEINISLEPSASPKREYVSLKVTNNNKSEFVLCKAIVKRMEWLRQDPIDGEKWISINLDRSGPLSWHHGGTDNDGYKKVHLNPEFINIAKVPKDMNQLIRGNMVFTFIVEEPYKFGRYKIWIEVYCKQNTKSKIESWIGCIDMVDPERTNELTIINCEDAEDWKYEIMKNAT